MNRGSLVMDENMGKYILDKLNKMDDKIDEIRSQGVETKVKLEEHDTRTRETQAQLTPINEKLSEYNEQLKIHIKGVQSLERRQDALEDKVAPIVAQHRTEKAISKLISEKWAARIKRITYISIVAGIAVSLLKLYSMI